ncbi:putative zinc finger protein, partial [Orchesella cincta]
HENKTYLCSDCGKSFKSASSLSYHVITIHKRKNKSATCSKCGKLFASSRAVSRHLREVHGSAPNLFSCSECNVVVKSKQQLNHHIKAIHNPEKLICPTCRKSFTTEKYLNQHVIRHHSTPAQKRELDQMPKLVMNNEFTRPKEAFHAQLVPRCLFPLSLFGVTSDPPMKKTRLIIALPAAKASSLRVVFHTMSTRSTAVSRHMRQVHEPAPKRVSCSECNVVAKSKHHLDQHIKAIHNPEKLICPTCRKSFTTAKYLNQHVTRNHSTLAQKESWTKCPKCEMRFCQNYLLKRHLLRSSCRLGKPEETKAAAEQE